MGSIWSGASKFLLEILEFFYGMTHSYGLAIVMLTVLVRIALYPLNQKQMKSMQQMQKIQPRLKVIQEKYGDDKQKLNEEMMRLYRENNVNPASGCMPLLVQLPILILLFNVLRTYDFTGSSFLGVTLGTSTIAGLGHAVGVAADPATGVVRILPVLTAMLKNPAGLANAGMYLPNLLLLIGISFLTWAQQKVSGAGNNPQMATMNTIMPFFMAFICLSMPGGVMLYWGLSSLIGVVQQYLVVRKTKEEMSVKPTLYRNKPVAGAAPLIYEADDDDDDEYEDDDDEYEYDDDDDDEYEDDEDDEERK